MSVSKDELLAALVLAGKMANEAAAVCCANVVTLSARVEALQKAYDEYNRYIIELTRKGK